jgi:MFS family permease
MLYLTAPLWVVELVPPKGRSVLAGIVGLFGVIGYIMAAYVGVGFFYYGGSASAQWRAPLAVGCFPPVLFVCIAAWLPESPRWLLAQDKGDQAWHLVRDLHTTPDDVNHDYATAEFYQMNKQHQLESSLVSTWWEIAKRPSYRKRALIAFGLPVILYSTGNLVITSK